MIETRRLKNVVIFVQTILIFSVKKNYKDSRTHSNSSNNDTNKFMSFFRTGVYPYEYMDKWEKFNETSLPQKEKILQQIRYGRF